MDPDPGGPKTCGSGGSRTLVESERPAAAVMRRRRVKRREHHRAGGGGGAGGGRGEGDGGAAPQLHPGQPRQVPGPHQVRPLRPGVLTAGSFFFALSI